MSRCGRQCTTQSFRRSSPTETTGSSDTASSWALRMSGRPIISARVRVRVRVRRRERIGFAVVCGRGRFRSSAGRSFPPVCVCGGVNGERHGVPTAVGRSPPPPLTHPITSGVVWQRRSACAARPAATRRPAVQAVRPAQLPPFKAWIGGIRSARTVGPVHAARPTTAITTIPTTNVRPAPMVGELALLTRKSPANGMPIRTPIAICATARRASASSTPTRSPEAPRHPRQSGYPPPRRS